jgi:hypothetical protein
VDLVIYLISGDAGPAAGDVRFEYPGNPISLESEEDGVLEITDLLINVVPEKGASGTNPGGDAQPVDGGEKPPLPPRAEDDPPPAPEGASEENPPPEAD